MKFLNILLIAVLLASCGPSAEQMTATSEAAIAQTQTAAPTLTPEPIFTPEPTAVPSEITDSKGVEMVLVPEGEFTMGSNDGDVDEKPVHQVFLNAYYIDKYEVTNTLYKACVDVRVCDRPTDTSVYPTSQYAQHPVVYVSWDMANEYCEWRGARLPTEAEWEKAARGTDGRTYPWGEDVDSTFANYGENVNDTTTVGDYPDGISPYGAYDMAGNVFEWVADWYDENYYTSSPESNPIGPDSGDYRVLRGGSWGIYYGNYLRSAGRVRGYPTDISEDLGFRCSRSP